MAMVTKNSGGRVFGQSSSGITRGYNTPVLNLSPNCADASSVFGTNYGVIIANANPDTTVQYIPQLASSLSSLASNTASSTPNILGNTTTDNNAIILSTGGANKLFTGKRIISIDTDLSDKGDVVSTSLTSNDYVFIGSHTYTNAGVGGSIDPYDNSVLIGQGVSSTGTSCVIVGCASSATSSSVAIGSNINLTGMNSVAVGYGINLAGNNSVLIGTSANNTSNTNSIIIGYSITAPGLSPYYMNIGGNIIGSTTGATAGTGVYTGFQGGVAHQGISTQTPSTGFSITIGISTSNLDLNPAGTLATGTITMPPSPVNGQLITISTSQTITSITVQGNSGQTLLNTPTTLLAGTACQFHYNTSLTTWFREF